MLAQTVQLAIRAGLRPPRFPHQDREPSGRPRARSHVMPGWRPSTMQLEEEAGALAGRHGGERWAAGSPSSGRGSLWVWSSDGSEPEDRGNVPGRPGSPRPGGVEQRVTPQICARPSGEPAGYRAMQAWRGRALTCRVPHATGYCVVKTSRSAATARRACGARSRCPGAGTGEGAR